jgi:hypothetical protein
LALACKKLIATATFVPKPVELGKACREAGKKMRESETYCYELIEFVRRCDALALEFAPEQWRAPYLTPEYQPLVHRMLELHSCFGNGDDDFWEDLGELEGFEEKEWNRNFRLALERARAEFPEPKEIEQQTEQITDEQTSTVALPPVRRRGRANRKEGNRERTGRRHERPNEDMSAL